MTIKRIALVGVLSLSAACGGGDDGGVRHDTEGLAESPVSAQGGASAAAVTADLNAAFAAGGDSAATGVMNLNGAAMGLALGGAAHARPLARVAPTSRQVTGDCICDDAGCTFDQCGDEESYITGQVTIDGEHYVWDLKFIGNNESGQFELDYVGDLTVSETLVDGSASATGGGSFENEGQTVNLELDWELGFNAIEVDPACESGPIGGSLDVFSRFAASSGDQSAGYYAEGSVAFGPGCGDVLAN